MSGQITRWHVGFARRRRVCRLCPFAVCWGRIRLERVRLRRSNVLFTGKSLTAVPALYPDVALIHVHESDLYGNCRIRGITVADWDLSRASKHVIVSAERIVSTDEIRSDPNTTAIPAFCVDAVCHVPYGSFPGNMAGEYFSDEEHLKAWLDAERDVEAYRAFLDQYLYGVDCFEDYLEICGGEERLAELRRLENN